MNKELKEILLGLNHMISISDRVHGLDKGALLLQRNQLLFMNGLTLEDLKDTKSKKEV